MAINFPNNPTLNQIYIFEDRTYQWNGVSWVNITKIDFTQKLTQQLINTKNTENYEVWIGNASQFNSISNKDPNTIYIVEEEL